MRESLLVLSAVLLGWSLNDLWRRERAAFLSDARLAALNEVWMTEQRRAAADQSPEPSAAGVA